MKKYVRKKCGIRLVSVNTGDRRHISWRSLHFMSATIFNSNDSISDASCESSNDSSLINNSVPSAKKLESSVNGSFRDKKSRAAKLDRKESYKLQRENYAKEKKRVEKELLSSFKDESIIIHADWLKVRGTLKSWSKVWVVLKPGLLLLYKNQKVKSSGWIGTILLSATELMERPSKKNGFCFKLFHSLDQSIWASKGPDGENIGAVLQPLPNSHLIFRSHNSGAGKCWMDALELTMRCSSLLLRSMSCKNTAIVPDTNETSVHWSQRTFGLEDEEDADEDAEEDEEEDGEDEEEDGENEESSLEEFSQEIRETTYVPDDVNEVFGTQQTEEFSEENKSIVWFLVKQVRPGMDLSKVVLPSFILEPRSFLDKLSDYYYHSYLLSSAVQNNEPYQRIKTIVSWYLSGYYKKPKGLKKPYNPILGEIFRCYWKNPDNSKTFYLSEQVSHHPPISAFYVTNRQAGFTISSSILTRSKFYGNSTSAILDGVATLTLLPRGEEYKLTMPYAHCKGILIGTLSMELGGKVYIDCEKTGYSVELEFKLRPFYSGEELSNQVSGKIKFGKETLGVIEGKWDETVKLKDKRTADVAEEILWEVTSAVKNQRLKRYTVPLIEQKRNESVKLWKKVSEAILNEDQRLATEEKTLLEEEQRNDLSARRAENIEWRPQLFVIDGKSGQYTYIHADHRPWDPQNDLSTYEEKFIIQTRTRHKVPMNRASSIVSVIKNNVDETDERVCKYNYNSDSSKFRKSFSFKTLQNSLTLVQNETRALAGKLEKLQGSLDIYSSAIRERDSNFNLYRDLVLLVILIFVLQNAFNWILNSKNLI